jgi:hypothetical protein
LQLLWQGGRSGTSRSRCSSSVLARQLSQPIWSCFSPGGRGGLVKLSRNDTTCAGYTTVGERIKRTGRMVEVNKERKTLLSVTVRGQCDLDRLPLTNIFNRGSRSNPESRHFAYYAEETYHVRLIEALQEKKSEFQLSRAWRRVPSGGLGELVSFTPLYTLHRSVHARSRFRAGDDEAAVKRQRVSRLETQQYL